MKFINFDKLVIEEDKLIEYLHTRKLTRIECVILLMKLKSGYESYSVIQVCEDLIKKRK